MVTALKECAMNDRLVCSRRISKESLLSFPFSRANLIPFIVCHGFDGGMTFAGKPLFQLRATGSRQVDV